MRNQVSYDSVFSAALPIDVWPVLAAVYKRVDAALLVISSHGQRGDRFLTTWRPVMSLLVVARSIGKFSFTTSELAGFNVQNVDQASVEEVWRIVAELRRDSGKSRSLTQA